MASGKVAPKSFLDRHRPSSFDQLVGNKSAKLMLQAMMHSNQIPNIIFFGDSGTGKTSAAKCLVRQMLGTRQAGESVKMAKKRVKDGHLYLNASDIRTSTHLLDHIHPFVNKIIPNMSDDKYRFVILDEVDSMLKSAHYTIISVMERYASSTRFVMMCNNLTKLPNEVVTRCVTIHFERLSHAECCTIARNIAQKEQLNCTDEGIAMLAQLADGDARHVINVMQLAAFACGDISVESVTEICDEPPPETMSQIIQLCRCQKFSEASRLCTVLHAAGFSATDFVSAALKTLQNPATEFDSELERLQYMTHLGLLMRNVTDGIDSLLQIKGTIAAWSMQLLHNAQDPILASNTGKRLSDEK